MCGRRLAGDSCKETEPECFLFDGEAALVGDRGGIAAVSKEGKVS